MATGIGRTFRRQMIAWVMNKTSTAPGTTYYVSLHTADPGDDGQTANEPTSTGGYARQSVTSANWTLNALGAVGTPQVVDNTNSVSFGPSAAAWSTGSSNLTHYGIWDHATNTAEANFVGRGSIANPTPVNAAGITLTFAAGAIDLTLDDDT